MATFQKRSPTSRGQKLTKNRYAQRFDQIVGPQFGKERRSQQCHAVHVLWKIVGVVHGYDGASVVPHDMPLSDPFCGAKRINALYQRSQMVGTVLLLRLLPSPGKSMVKHVYRSCSRVVIPRHRRPLVGIPWIKRIASPAPQCSQCKLASTGALTRDTPGPCWSQPIACTTNGTLSPHIGAP